MSLDYVKFSSGFEKFMPKEYRDMVEHGPFGKKVSVSQMGSFKEVLEEHPMCAGCAMTLFIRLAMIAFPNPEPSLLERPAVDVWRYHKLPFPSCTATMVTKMV
jgi:pyruvate ferredoxin oxidoreductase beta subunit